MRQTLDQNCLRIARELMSISSSILRNDLNQPKPSSSTRTIAQRHQYLRGANAVIKNNKYRLDKELFTLRESEQLIYHMSLNSGEEEASWVGNKISELKDSGFNYEDMAILYRANYPIPSKEGIALRVVKTATLYRDLGF